MGRITPDTRLGDVAAASKDFEKLSKWILLYTPAGAAQTVAEKYGRERAELICQALNCWEDDAISGTPASVNLYSREEIARQPDKSRTHLFFMAGEPGAPWVLVCPGGAYAAIDLLGEGFAPALELNRQGYNVFILFYRTAKHGIMNAVLEDTAAAVRRIRAQAGKYRIARDDYAVMGFSAGGHLAALWAAPCGYASFSQPKPRAVLLGYPALCMEVLYKAAHDGEAGENRLLKLYLDMIGGRKAEREALEPYSPEKHVTRDYPPTYIVHCADDVLVPPASTDAMTAALVANGVPVQTERPLRGGHGIGDGTGTDAEEWIERACAFWQENAK